MNFKVLCSRGGTGYLVQRDTDYCYVDLISGQFSANKEPGVFLKLGYFEDVDQTAPEALDRIAQILSDPAAQVRL